MSGVLDLPQLDVALALLDRVSDQFRRSGLTLGADDECLLLLTGLVDQERSPLGLLLSDLLGFDSGGEFGGEGQMLQHCRQVSLPIIPFNFVCTTYRKRHIVKGNVEASRTAGQVVPDETGDILTLRNQLAGVELRDNALEDFVHDGRKNPLVEVAAKGAVDLREGVDAGSGQNTAGDVDHLQVLGTGQGSDVARLCAHVVDDGRFEPGNSEVRS